jgi:hypothetical protein
MYVCLNGMYLIFVGCPSLQYEGRKDVVGYRLLLFFIDEILKGTRISY